MAKKVKKKEIIGKSWKSIILALAIAIILTAFIFQVISTIYESPEWTDFCPESPPLYNDEQNCTSAGGRWTADPSMDPSIPATPKSVGYCDITYNCQKEFESADVAHRKKVFIIAVITGLIALIFGIILGLQSVSLGLMGGGVITMFIGTVQYWDRLGKYLRLIILGAVLIILIWIGYKKLRH
ncbi:MAG: hypothetical protein ABIE22_03025 [archaeon]